MLIQPPALRAPLLPAGTAGQRGPVALRGRRDELAVLDGLLSALGRRRGAVAVVEGVPGSGKTSVLDEIVLRAAERSLRVVRGGADPGAAGMMPLGPLLDALLGGESPILDAAELRVIRGLADPRFWLMQEVQERLERTALQTPLVVVIDDLQFADDATLLALRKFSERLSSHAILWVLAARPGGASASTVNALEESGAHVMRLGPLGRPSVAELAEDVLGAVPDAAILDLACGVEGQPLFLAELLRGMRDESLILTEDGRARLAGDGMPSRFRDAVDVRLRRLSDPAREALQMASVLGTRFSAEQLSTLLDRSVQTLLAPLREALASELLVEKDDVLAFRHALIRDAVDATLPATMRLGLRRQAVVRMLALDVPDAERAVLLADIVEPGDRAALDAMRRGALELAPVAPATAVRIDRRVLALTPVDDPERSLLVAEALPRFFRAGLAGEARALGRAALERATTPEHLAILHLGLAQLDLDDDQRSAAQHARSALALPGLPRDLRLRLRIVLSVGLMLSGNAASEGLDEALVEGLSSSDPATERAALLGSCVAAYLRRDFGEALSYANRARATGAGAEPAAQTLFFASRNAAELWGARVRAVVGEVHEALEVTDDGVDVARRDGRTHDLRSWMATRARALLACGRPQDACREAEAVLEMLEGAGDAGGVAEAARYTMGRAALHGGGPDGARVASRTATALMAADTPAARRAGRWLMAQAVDAQGDQGAAVEFLDETLLAPGGARVDHESPDDAFIAMRILSRAGALDRAETVVAECERQARRNPGSPWLQTTASHARALLVRDISGLRASIDAVPDMPSPLLGAEVLEDAAWVFRDGEPDEAVTFLDRALELHLAAGAEGDAHRVRQKLRELGIRRQRASRAVSPWGLTEAEVVVAELIARGCTNREAAQRLFLSQHTVSTHLRHTFEKLGIHSRVELAMLFGDRVATSGDRRQVA